MMTHTVSHASIRRAYQLTLPPDVRAALHVQEGDEIAFDIAEDGTVALRGMSMVPSDQKWFWTEEWQSGEHRASEDIAAGRTTIDNSAKDFLDSLDALDQDSRS